jgi:hypothetical protein
MIGAKAESRLARITLAPSTALVFFRHCRGSFV